MFSAISNEFIIGNCSKGSKYHVYCFRTNSEVQSFAKTCHERWSARFTSSAILLFFLCYFSQTNLFVEECQCYIASQVLIFRIRLYPSLRLILIIISIRTRSGNMYGLNLPPTPNHRPGNQHYFIKSEILT